MPRGNPLAVALGPGELFFAILGSPLPADHLAAVFDTAPWTRIGYTEEGSTQNYAPEYEDVVVAEELDPIDSVPTGRTMGVSFGMAENLAGTYKLAMNGGTITVVAADPGPPAVAAHVTFEPPVLGAETNTMIGFRAEDKLEAWVWHNCKNVGAAETQRRKGAAKALIPAEFRAYVPSDGSAPFKRWSARAGEETP